MQYMYISEVYRNIFVMDISVHHSIDSELLKKQYRVKLYVMVVQSRLRLSKLIPIASP